MVFDLHKSALQLGALLDAEAGFQVQNQVVFNQVIVQCETDEITVSVMNEIQDMRECWAGGSTWKGRKVIRISVCSWATTDDDVERSVESFRKALKNVKQSLEI